MFDKSITKENAQTYLTNILYEWKYISKDNNKLFATYQLDDKRCDIYDNSLLANVLIMLYDVPPTEVISILNYLVDLYDNDNDKETLISAAFSAGVKPNHDTEWSRIAKDVGNNSMVCISFVRFILKYRSHKNVNTYKRVVKGILRKINSMINVCSDFTGYRGHVLGPKYISTEHMLDLYALTNMIIVGNVFPHDIDEHFNIRENCKNFVINMWYEICKKEDVYMGHTSTAEEFIECKKCESQSNPDEQTSEHIRCLKYRDVGAYGTGVGIDGKTCTINYGGYSSDDGIVSLESEPADCNTWNMLSGVDNNQTRKHDSLKFITDYYIVKNDGEIGIRFSERSECPQFENTGSYICALIEYRSIFGPIDSIMGDKATEIEDMYSNIYKIITNGVNRTKSSKDKETGIIYATNIKECATGLGWSYFGKGKGKGGHLASTMYCLVACLAAGDSTFNIYKYPSNSGISTHSNLNVCSNDTNVCIKKSKLILIVVVVLVILLLLLLFIIRR
jgi:hypothetical protein